jgi:hypothetical protein
LRFAGYVHPVICSLGPRSQLAGFETTAKLLSALRRHTGSECLLITGSRFPLWMKEHGSASILDGIRVVEIDEVPLLRRMSEIGVTPLILDQLLCEPDCREHPAVRILADEIARRCADFRPDVLISYAVQADFLAALWPQSLRLHTEAGPYSRNPYPFSLFFDHLGMYKKSVIGQHGSRLADIGATTDAKAVAAKFQSHNARALSAADPFRSIDLRGRFDRLCLLPLQVSNCFPFDSQCGYRTQMEYLLDVVSAAPADVGVVVTEYLECGQGVGNDEQGKAYLRRSFPNMIFLDQFRSYCSPSQFLVPRVDGVWSVSSNVAYQALMFGRLLGTPASTHLAGIAHATDIAEFFARLQPQDREPNVPDRTAFLAWQLERYVVPEALLADGRWLHDYFARRRDAARSADPLDAFVPIADPARLEEAWMARAPKPAAIPFADPLQRVLQSTSWRVTAPLRAAATAIRSCGRVLARWAERIMRGAGTGTAAWDDVRSRPLRLPHAMAQRRGKYNL